MRREVQVIVVAALAGATCLVPWPTTFQRDSPETRPTTSAATEASIPTRSTAITAPTATAASAPPTPTTREVRSIPAGALSLEHDFAAVEQNVLVPPGHDVAYASIAVGRQLVLVATGPAFVLFDKSGREVDRVGSIEFFRSVVSEAISGYGDPRAFYDHRSGRFVLVLAALAGAGPCRGICPVLWLLGVSREAEPGSLRAAEWHLYRFDGSLEGGITTQTHGDYNVVSVDDRTLILTGTVETDGTDLTGKIWLFDKNALYSGTAIDRPASDFVRVRDPATGRLIERIIPAVMYGTSRAMFLAGATGTECGLVVLGIEGTAAAPDLTVRSVPFSGLCGGPFAPQLGGGTPLAVGSTLSSPPVYRDGTIWIALKVHRRYPSGTVSAVRVVEVDVRDWPAQPRIVAQAELSEADVWYSYPALAVDAARNVALVALRSSLKEYASVYYTGRLAADAPGTLRPVVALKRGTSRLDMVSRQRFTDEATYGRFAGYSGAALDPSDGSGWLIGQYAKDVCTWGTWVGRVSWRTLAQPVPATVPALPPPRPFEGSCLAASPRTQVPTQLMFLGQEDAGVRPGAPAGAIALLFEVAGKDLHGTDRIREVSEPQPNLGWSTSAGRLVVYVPRDMRPGPNAVRMRLVDGWANAFFTLMPP